MQRRSLRRGTSAAAAALCLVSACAFAQELNPLSRVSPEFPHEAVAAGADEGHVRARITIDASGEVSHVDIIESKPRRVFDRAVLRSLSQWRYPPGDSGRTVEVDVDFKR